MRRALVAAALLPLAARAADAPPVAEPEASLVATGYWYAMRDEPDFGVGVLAYDRGRLHLEARYNYEARNSTSVFVGGNWSGGEAVTWSVTPILGGLTGATRGVVPGLEAGVAWRELDAYVEAEYVRDLGSGDDSYVYAWTELGWRPVEWLRVGLAGQRTRTVTSERSLQRGVFAQVTLGRVTVGVYGFNPDDASRYLIVALGLAL